MDYRCPACGSDLGRRKISRAVVARLEVDCSRCGKRIRVNVHPVERAVVYANFGAILVLGGLAYWLESRELVIAAVAVAMAGSLAIPIVERVYLRRWPRYAPLDGTHAPGGARCAAEPLPHRGPRIALRRLREADLTVFQAYRHDPETGRYQGWTPQPGEQAAAFLAQMARAPLFAPGEWIQLGIESRETGELIGDIGVRVEHDGRSAEIGFTLRPDARGAGFGAEAVGEAIRLVFAHTLADRVVGITDVRNTPSIRLMERVGMRKVATQESVVRGERCAEQVHEIARG